VDAALTVESASSIKKPTIEDEFETTWPLRVDVCKLHFMKIGFDSAACDQNARAPRAARIDRITNTLSGSHADA
jgi:hypothetical protein